MSFEKKKNKLQSVSDRTVTMLRSIGRLSGEGEGIQIELNLRTLLFAPHTSVYVRESVCGQWTDKCN